MFAEPSPEPRDAFTTDLCKRKGFRGLRLNRPATGGLFVAVFLGGLLFGAGAAKFIKAQLLATALFGGACVCRSVGENGSAEWLSLFVGLLGKPVIWLGRNVFAIDGGRQGMNIATI